MVQIRACVRAFVRVFVCVCVSLPLSPSVPPFVCLSVCLCVCLSISLLPFLYTFLLLLFSVFSIYIIGIWPKYNKPSYASLRSRTYMHIAKFPPPLPPPPPFPRPPITPPAFPCKLVLGFRRPLKRIGFHNPQDRS